MFAELIAEVSRSVADFHLSQKRIKPAKDVRLMENTPQNEAVNVILGGVETLLVYGPSDWDL